MHNTLLLHKSLFSTFFLVVLFGFALPLTAVAAPLDIPYEAVYSFSSTTTDMVPANITETPTELPNTYARATVTKIVDSGVGIIDGKPQEWQTLEIKITGGAETGKVITINNGKEYIIGSFQKYAEGDTVIVAKPPSTPGAIKEVYYITDRYRSHALLFVLAIFFTLALVFGRARGASSIIGMIFSVLVIFYWIIPRITAGGGPLATCLMGAAAIMCVSIYISHGFNQRTTVALVSTFIALGIAVGIDIAFVSLTHLNGLGAEEAFYLQFNNVTVDPRGLLLGAIILGVLGVLDDVTTGQAAAVEEIHTANPRLTFRDLYRKGVSVGREHIASLVNTLVLAYVGASFPLLLLYSTQSLQPLWVTLNSNFISEEIVRTLVGSSVLVIAVPLTTALAAAWYGRPTGQLRNVTTHDDTPVEATEKFWK